MRKIHFTSERLIVYSFMTAIFAGTILLKLPFSSTKPIQWIDALFMATSSICVTGLSVINVGADLTRTGQCFLLLLLQLGGLGIMTFSLFFSLAMGLRTSLTSRLSLLSISKHIDTHSLLKTLLFVLLATFFIEIAGSILLFTHLQKILPLGEAIFSSVFHAISAFCNCGFSLYSDSLIRFQNDFFVLAVMGTLIIFGGLGFIVLYEILFWLKAVKLKQKYKFSLYSKICITATFILLILGTVLLWLLEKQNVLSSMPFPQQLMNAFFLGVVPRTAGFNSVDIASLSNASLFFIITLMFIGGCSGSTAGGIKVSTFVVLLAFFRSALNGSFEVRLFKRNISLQIMADAFIIFIIAIFMLTYATFILQITEMVWTQKSNTGRGFLDIMFEATSAFGTVGLSTGVTSMLSFEGKLIIIALMFLGRVGPITLALALLTRNKKQVIYKYVEEDVLIG